MTSCTRAWLEAWKLPEQGFTDVRGLPSDGQCKLTCAQQFNQATGEHQNCLDNADDQQIIAELHENIKAEFSIRYYQPNSEHEGHGPIVVEEEFVHVHYFEDSSPNAL